MENLEYLDIKMKYLEKVKYTEYAFLKLKKLSTISFSSVLLTELPDEIIRHPKITKIELASNPKKKPRRHRQDYHKLIEQLKLIKDYTPIEVVFKDSNKRIKGKSNHNFLIRESDPEMSRLKKRI